MKRNPNGPRWTQMDPGLHSVRAKKPVLMRPLDTAAINRFLANGFAARRAIQEVVAIPDFDRLIYQALEKSAADHCLS